VLCAAVMLSSGYMHDVSGTHVCIHCLSDSLG